MRVSVPGVPGVYYDSDTKSTALSTAFSMVGRKAPKPHGYAMQALPLLWSIDIDLQEVPNDHPFQYLHPEGAHSIEELTRDRKMPGPNVSRELERTLQFAMAVNRETERGINEIIGRGDDEPEEEGTVIEIREVDDDGDPIGESDVVPDGPDLEDGSDLDDGSDLLDDIPDGDDGGTDDVEDGLDGVTTDADDESDDEFGHDDESDLANGR